VLIIGVPFFLAFVAVGRVVSLAEGRLLEAVTGVRMPRRPVYQPTGEGIVGRILGMLKDPRTWSTLAYLLLMLPLGIIYFVIAIVLLALSLAFLATPFVGMGVYFGWLDADFTFNPAWIGSLLAAPFMLCLGFVTLTALLHIARGVGRMHARLAKVLLVRREGAPEAAVLAPAH
jgi:hypothetical protein